VGRASPARQGVLINNAGAMFGARGITQDGLERTFALNHMAYFVVTEVCASGCTPSPVPIALPARQMPLAQK
jgi:retinol dehydrogenase 12